MITTAAGKNQSKNLLVKDKQEKDKIRTKPDKNGKRGKARQCQSSVTVKKAKKVRKDADHLPILKLNIVLNVFMWVLRESKAVISMSLQKISGHTKPQNTEEKKSGLPHNNIVGNKMHKAFPLPGESSHWQYKFPLPVEEYKESLDNSSKEIATSSSNQEKEEPSQYSDIRHLIREECCVEVCEEQKQNMEDTMLELVEIYRQNKLLCMHDNVDDLIESALNSKLLSINSQQDKRECDVPVCENFPVCDDHSDIFSNSKNDDDISSDDDDFEDVEYVEASLPDPEIISVEEENVVQQEEEEVDLEDISQIQDVVLREKLLSINRLISNIESLNENPTPDLVLNSSVSIPIFEESNNSLSDNFSPEFKTFCDHTKETRSGNTTTHAYDSLLEYDSFCFEIEPDQERLINVVKSVIFDDSTNDPLLEEADLFIALDNSIPPGIENFADDSEGDIRFLEALLNDDFILSLESSDSNFEDNPSIPRPLPEPPDAEFDFKQDAEEEISIDKIECLYPNDKFDVSNDEDVNYYSFMFVIYPEMFPLLLFAESEDTIFDPGISD
nr:hypothetical protein [Tanacetum cinerariifolium]